MIERKGEESNKRERMTRLLGEEKMKTTNNLEEWRKSNQNTKKKMNERKTEMTRDKQKRKATKHRK